MAWTARGMPLKSFETLNSTIEIEAVRTSIKRDARFEIANFGFEPRHLRLANIWRIRYHDVEPPKRLAAVQCVPAISVDESCTRLEPEPYCVAVRDRERVR